MNEFTKARLKLTVWYILISAALLMIFSVAAVTAEQRAFSGIQQALARTPRARFLNTPLIEKIDMFEDDFRNRLLTFDVLLLLTAAGASYFLATRTLKPIQEMIKLKEEFSADASHELRTPLTIINMEIEALRRTEKNLPEKYQTSFSNIQEEVKRMKKLVDGLLTIVRETDQDKNAWENFNLTQLAKECFEQLEPLAKEKKLKYTLKSTPTRSERARLAQGAAPTLPLDRGRENSLPVYADKEQIKQVILILLDNAIKYTQKGSVELSLEKTDHTAKIVVADSGDGIPEKDMAHIFDRFYRVNNKPKDLQPGTGLGLAIAKKIVEGHGGKISVESKAREGSKFVVMI